MCTAIGLHGAHYLFGRTLDLECSYGEEVVITPRRAPLRFLHAGVSDAHLAMIGVGCVREGGVLYFDALNEAGLCAAALNFPASAVYHAPRTGALALASFEVIPFVLAHCRTVEQAVALLQGAVITAEAAPGETGATPLHWMIADSTRAVVVESVGTGVMILENPLGVLTNEPPFAHHMAHLCDFMQLSAEPPENKLCPALALAPYSRGLGAIGLPGDFSSMSRLVRAVFAGTYTENDGSARGEISRFFHVMDTVTVPDGCVRTTRGERVRTVYTDCFDTTALTCCFTTYQSRRIRAVPLDHVPREGRELARFSMAGEEDVQYLTTRILS